jgi:hypothetical protein
MYRSHDRKKKSMGRSGQHGIKDENIDRQILVLHQAMGDKLLTKPTLIEQMQQNLESRHDKGQMAYGCYLSWCAILELYEQPEQFMAALLEDTPRMRRLRRHTPFVGLLSEEERQSALNEQACGETDITTLL